MRRLAPVATAWLGLLLLLAPLKFGNSVSTRWVSMFPLTWGDWVFAPWPVIFVPVAAGLGLALVLLATPPVTWAALRPARQVFLALAGLVLASLIGLLRTTSWEVATSFLWHTLSMLAFALALYLQVRHQPGHRRALIACFAAGILLLCLQVLHQVLWGFQDVQEQLLYRAEYESSEFNSGIMFNVRQGRATASFALSNSLAAHFILVAPVLLALVWEGCGRVQPPRLTRLIFVPLAAVPLGWCLGETGSRAAFVALALALASLPVLYGVAHPQRLRAHLKWLVPALLGAVLAAVPLYLLIQGARPSLSSAVARLDYWRAAWDMFRAQPLTGAGLGEFFPHYLRLKPPGAEETRLAHSVFYHFLSQCGVIGGVAAVYLVILPLLVWRQWVRGELVPASPLTFWAALVGCGAWGVHALVDFNVHIPATLMLVPGLLILAGCPWAAPPAAAPPATRPRRGRLTLALALLALLNLANVWKFPGEAAFARLQLALDNPQADLGALTADIQRAGDLLPLSPHPWLKAAHAYLVARRFAYAEAALRQAIRREPHYAAGHFRLAWALAGQGRFAEAETELRTAVAWYPHAPDYPALWRALQHAKADAQRRAARPPE